MDRSTGAVKSLFLASKPSFLLTIQVPPVNELDR
jgi:hypothetical protein